MPPNNIIWWFPLEVTLKKQCFNTLTCYAGIDLFVPVPALFMGNCLWEVVVFLHLLCFPQTSLSWISSIFFFFPSVKSMEGVYRGLSETNTSLQKLLPMSDSASESGSPVGVQDRKQLLISTQNGISIVNFVHTHNKLTFTQLNILWNVRVHVKYADGNYGRFKNLKNWGINTTLIVSVWKTMWSYCFTTK